MHSSLHVYIYVGFWSPLEHKSLPPWLSLEYGEDGILAARVPCHLSQDLSKIRSGCAICSSHDPPTFELRKLSAPGHVLGFKCFGLLFVLSAKPSTVVGSESRKYGASERRCMLWPFIVYFQARLICI